MIEGSSLSKNRYRYVPKNDSAFFEKNQRQIGPYPTLLNTLELLRGLFATPEHKAGAVANSKAPGLASVGQAVLGNVARVAASTAAVAAAVAGGLKALDLLTGTKELPTGGVPEDEGYDVSTPSGSSRVKPTTPLGKIKRHFYGKSVNAAIRAAAQKMGENEGDLRAFIDIESGGDPRARGSYTDKRGVKRPSQYIGLGQFGNSAWKAVQPLTGPLPPVTGGDDDPRYDPYLNALATAAYMKQNRKYLKDHGIAEPTLGNLYMAHNIGPVATVEVLTKPYAKWHKGTVDMINNQARELKVGGAEHYAANAERSMQVHYAQADTAGANGEDVAASDKASPATVNASMVKETSYQPSTPSPIQVPKAPVVTPIATKPAAPRTFGKIASNNESRGPVGGSSPYGPAPQFFTMPNGLLVAA